MPHELLRPLQNPPIPLGIYFLYIVVTLCVPGVFILRLNTPQRTSLHLNRTQWSTQCKATPREAFNRTDKGLCGSTGKTYKTAAPMTRPDERSSLRVSIAPWNLCGMRATIFLNEGFRYGGQCEEQAAAWYGRIGR
jgi:hypothetical protein